MKWFDRWFYKQTKKAWENKSVYEREAEESQYVSIKEARMGTLSAAVEMDPHDLNDGLRIDIKKVIGGSIVTFRHYDRKTDRNNNKTYIITDQQDFNKELGNIITLESMRQ